MDVTSAFVIYVIKFVVLIDVMFSIMFMNIYGDDRAVLKIWECNVCGANIGSFTLSLSLWKMATHSCDDNLC